MKEGFASISIKGVPIIRYSPEALKELGNRVDIILVSNEEWNRLENLLQPRKEK